MAELAPTQVETYLTPVAFGALHEKGIVITPNGANIARLGEVIGNELPDYALPDTAEHLDVIVRGSTNVDDSRKWTENDVTWLHAAPGQLYYPSGELQKPRPNTATSATKADLSTAGRFILEFTAVNPGTWGEKRPIRFAEQWTARRALEGIKQNVPNEFKGAFSDIPLLGKKARAIARVLEAVRKENLDPFVVTQRKDAINS